MPEDFEPPPPATLDDHGHVTGPFLHGTRADLAPGDLVLPGRPSHFRPDRPLAHVYFTTRPETAAWGAELAAALAPGASEPRARVYEVEPTGPFEDDPNVTDKKLPGQPDPLLPLPRPAPRRRRGHGLAQHSPEELEGMLAGLARLRARAWTSSRTSPRPGAGLTPSAAPGQSRGESEGHIHIHLTPSFSYSRIRNSIILRRIAWGGGAS